MGVALRETPNLHRRALEAPGDSSKAAVYGNTTQKILSRHQQATEPSSLTPQAWWPPTLTEANFPSGGVASKSVPQQAREPSALNPQA